LTWRLELEACASTRGATTTDAVRDFVSAEAFEDLHAFLGHSGCFITTTRLDLSTNYISSSHLASLNKRA